MTDEVEHRSHRIGVDTGAYSSGKLTALGLEGGDVWHVQTNGSDRSDAVLQHSAR